ncbi:MAG: tRNA (adenosine(37)-N6)-threonylcarbamoyltransferase complex ATPase subunit type 1 TsaE [Candidatus Saccharimonadales bacterium]
MSTDLTLQINSTNSDDTERLGERLGARLKGGEVLVLSSDLGGGKTTLTRGIAKGAGSNDGVASPTFTISRIYSAPKFEIHHFDFYRLNEPGIITHELNEVMHDTNTVVIIEWADIVREALPKEHCLVTITQTGDDTREITVTLPESLAYLTKGLDK